MLIEHGRGHGQRGGLRDQLDLDGTLEGSFIAIGVEGPVEHLHGVAPPIGVEADESVREPSLDVDGGDRSAETETTRDGVEEIGQR
jgi:hypothetical protein